MSEGAPVIRLATVDDFDAVAFLLAELGRPTLMASTVEPARAVYARHVARADTASLLAEMGGRPVGFCSLEFRDRLNRGTPQAWIPDLIVTEAARRHGAGRELLRRAFEMAWDHGCWSVTLESGYQREAAHELYRSSGMTQDGYYFTLLRPTDDPS